MRSRTFNTTIGNLGKARLRAQSTSINQQLQSLQ